MKHLALIPLLVLTSCATRHKPELTIKPLASPAVEPVESVRYAEVIRPYHIGRYVDPNHPDLMHEQHPVFRVEAYSRWNLKPGDPSASVAGVLNPPADAAYSPPPTNDVVLSELNRQKDATERVMWEAFQLARSYDELQKVIKDMTAVAKNHSWLGTRVAIAERRVGDLEAELRKLNAPPTASTSEVHDFNTDAADAATTPNP